MIVSTVKAALLAASSYFSARAAYYDLTSKKLLYDLIEHSESRQRKIVETIEELRQKGSEAATQQADMLFKELKKEKEKYEKYLSNTDVDRPDIVRDK
jgi:outer membrane protein TolC